MNPVSRIDSHRRTAHCRNRASDELGISLAVSEGHLTWDRSEICTSRGAWGNSKGCKFLKLVIVPRREEK